MLTGKAGKNPKAQLHFASKGIHNVVNPPKSDSILQRRYAGQFKDNFSGFTKSFYMKAATLCFGLRCIDSALPGFCIW